MGKFIVKFIGWALKRNLSLKERNEIVMHILDNLGALPLSAIIQVSDDGSMLINNRSLDAEKALQLRESAKNALNNQAFILINQQVMYEALIHGGLKSLDVNGLMFTRAAVWWGQRLEDHLKILAQEQEPSFLMD